jgi:phage terminase Nu1 subunit (DNA packaging protein)
MPRLKAKRRRKADAAPIKAPSSVRATIGAEGIARLLMTTPRRVQQLVADGWIEKAGRNGYTIAGAVHGYIRFLKDEQRRASKTASLSRVQDARAREIELRTARDEHVLMETAECITVVDEIVGGLRSEIAGVPARVTRDIELRRKIATEIDDIFRRTADRLEQRASELRASGEAAVPVEDDDAPQAEAKEGA